MSDHKKKKIKLQKKTGPIHAARVKTGLTMPVGMVSDNSLISFRDMKDLRAKYFTFKGRLPRKPFIVRILMLSFAQFIMTLILLNKIFEALMVQETTLAIVFAIIFIVFSIPMIASQVSLGYRRCHDLNQPGIAFIIPYLCYIASFLTTAWHYEMASLITQSVTAVLYLALFSVRGTVGDNAYDRERSRG
jgi:uncharacterized membrane protein YhaH (DUF805 family)